jgi:hypothetical protein
MSGLPLYIGWLGIVIRVDVKRTIVVGSEADVASTLAR